MIKIINECVEFSSNTMSSKEWWRNDRRQPSRTIFHDFLNDRAHKKKLDLKPWKCGFQHIFPFIFFSHDETCWTFLDNNSNSFPSLNIIVNYYKFSFVIPDFRLFTLLDRVKNWSAYTRSLRIDNIDSKWETALENRFILVNIFEDC